MATAKKKKTVQKKKEAKADYYVGLGDPIPIYKQILQTSKDILDMQKRYETVKQIRAHKTDLLNKFGALTTQLKADIAKLQTELPKVQEPKIVEKKVPVKTVAKTMEKPSSEITRLEKELADIQKKISKLN